MKAPSLVRSVTLRTTRIQPAAAASPLHHTHPTHPTLLIVTAKVRPGGVHLVIYVAKLTSSQCSAVIFAGFDPVCSGAVNSLTSSQEDEMEEGLKKLSALASLKSSASPW